METIPNAKFSDDNSNNRQSEKKILYFSDGSMEVNDEPEVEETRTDSFTSPVDPKQLNWAPWVWHHTVSAGSKTLQVCDYLGESLASFFGITTPKYQFEINEYHRMKKAEEEAQKERDLEMGSWMNNSVGLSSTEAILSPPSQDDFKQGGGGDTRSVIRY